MKASRSTRYILPRPPPDRLHPRLREGSFTHIPDIPFCQRPLYLTSRDSAVFLICSMHCTLHPTSSSCMVWIDSDTPNTPPSYPPKKCRQRKPATPGKDSERKITKDPRTRENGPRKHVTLVDGNELSAIMRSPCAALVWDWGCPAFTEKMTNPRNQ